MAGVCSMLRVRLCALIGYAKAWLAPPFSEARRRCKFLLFAGRIAGAAHVPAC
jgi:hypothetical protein